MDIFKPALYYWTHAVGQGAVPFFAELIALGCFCQFCFECRNICISCCLIDRNFVLQFSHLDFQKLKTCKLGFSIVRQIFCVVVYVINCNFWHFISFSVFSQRAMQYRCLTFLQSFLFLIHGHNYFLSELATR